MQSSFSSVHARQTKLMLSTGKRGVIFELELY